jgi:hypothetical protein
MKMERYLLQIEFRYYDAPTPRRDWTSRGVKKTIGVYDDFEEACKHGNELLENLESKFELHQFPNGTNAKKERFSKNGGCFGGKKTLVTNLAYLKTPFDFFTKIETLYYDNIDETIDEVLDAIVRYNKFKIKIVSE